MKTLEQIDPPPLAFDSTAVANISQAASPKFWRQFRRNNDARFEKSANLTKPVGLDSVAFEDRLHRLIKEEPELEIVDEHIEPRRQHFMIQWTGSQRKVYFGAIGAGIVISRSNDGTADGSPFVSLAQGGGSRWSRIVRLAVGVGFMGGVSVLWFGALLISFARAVELSPSERLVQLAGTAFILVVCVCMSLIPCIWGLRAEQLAKNRGFSSPAHADLGDLAQIADRLIRKLRSTEGAESGFAREKEFELDNSTR